MMLSRFCHSRIFAALFLVTGVLVSSMTAGAPVSTGGVLAPKMAPTPIASAPSATQAGTPTPTATVGTAPTVMPESSLPALSSKLSSVPETTAPVSPEILPSPPIPASPVVNNAPPTIDAPGRPVPAHSAATAAVASAGSLTQIAMVLVLVVGLIAGIAWLLKKLGVARAVGGTTIRIVSGINLSNRERILVVEIADQWLVVGVSPGRINTLATLPRQDAPTARSGSQDGFEAPAGKNFAQWLKQTMDKRNGAANER